MRNEKNKNINSIESNSKPRTCSYGKLLYFHNKSIYWEECFIAFQIFLMFGIVEES